MVKLLLATLGPLQLALDRAPVTGFKYHKAKALLVYLAVEAHRPHGRSRLAGLLWPDCPERAALRNLRCTLHDLREAIRDQEANPPFLNISSDEVQFNRSSNHWLDVAEFVFLVSHPGSLARAPAATSLEAEAEDLESAVALYRGPFLESLSADHSDLLTEWIRGQREALSRRLSTALERLAAIHQECGEFAQARAWLQRLLALEPWREEAHRQLMLLLALDGRRGAALKAYEACRHLLASELGVEPGHETTALYRRIRDGDLLTKG